MEKSFRERIADAMRWEDATLRKNIDKYRLEEWALSTDEVAREAVDGFMDRFIAERMVVGGEGEGEEMEEE